MGKDSLIQAVEQYVRRRPTTGLEEYETKKFLDLAWLHALVLCDVARDVGGCNPLPTVRSISALTPLDYLSVFQSIHDAYLHHFQSGDVGEWLLAGGNIANVPKTLASFVTECVRGSNNPTDAVRRIMQIADFPLRIDLSGATSVISDLLEINATREHVPSAKLIDIARSYIDSEFIRVFVDNCIPSHGNGSVAFATPNGSRTRLLSLREKDEMLDTCCLKRMFHGTILEDAFSHYPNVMTMRDICPSQVLSVPKTWRKQRIVAIEDVTRMYAQQTVRSGLYAAIEHTFGRHVNFSRADLNADLARYGSMIHGTFATIDLSSASDSIGTTFVQHLFQSTPLWPVLDAVRTLAFETEEHRCYQSRIFATMGNAVCFPILTLVLCLICIEAGAEPTSCDFRVYGDDIVLPDSLVPNLYDLLAKYGFSVNSDKSYTSANAPFRESCGGEYFLGEDVSPVRISRKFAGLESRTWDNVIALIDLFNRSYDIMPFLRNELARVISNNFTLSFPFSPSGAVGLRSIDPKSAMSQYQRYWNVDYQRGEYEVQYFRRISRSQRREQSISLAEWLSRANNRDDSKTDVIIENPVITSAALSSGRAILEKHVYSLDMQQINHARKRYRSRKK